MFKTMPCNAEHEHELNLCHYHHGEDMRRNPYMEHSFAYYPSAELLHEASGGLGKEEDMLCRNKN